MSVGAAMGAMSRGNSKGDGAGGREEREVGVRPVGSRDVDAVGDGVGVSSRLSSINPGTCMRSSSSTAPTPREALKMPLVEGVSVGSVGYQEAAESREDTHVVGDEDDAVLALLLFDGLRQATVSVKRASRTGN